MKRTSTLPGIIGILANRMGLSRLAIEARSSVLKLRRYANNNNRQDSLTSGRLMEICLREGVEPNVIYKRDGNIHLASTPYGWCFFRDGEWVDRAPYVGTVDFIKGSATYETLKVEMPGGVNVDFIPTLTEEEEDNLKRDGPYAHPSCPDFYIIFDFTWIKYKPGDRSNYTEYDGPVAGLKLVKNPE